MKKYKKISAGFTLIELLVSMSVLLAISGISAGIFVSAILEQKRILARQGLYGQLSYALEYMSKSMRMAGRDLTGDCLGVQGRNFLLTNQDTSGSGEYLGIKFINQSDNNICQEFFLDKSEVSTILKVVRGLEAPVALTSDKIKINSLRFIINNNTDDNTIFSSFETDNIQPKITILLDAELVELPNQPIKIQTTVSQRNMNIR
jgi:prepilin-type N-terminal cleavage/methylation domain-containing protein